MSPVRTFALVLGIAFLLIGVMGFLPPPFVTTPHDMHGVTAHQNHGYLLGLFPVNLWHNLIHMAFGLWGVWAFVTGFSASRLYARCVTVIYAVLAVMGLFPRLDTVFGLIPIHGNDAWLHGLIAAVSAYFGWLPEIKHAAHDVTHGTPLTH